MTLLNHRPRTRSGSAGMTPFWSLTLPHWAVAANTPPRALPEPDPATWTCARCGAVMNGISAAMEHINLHSLHEASQPVSGDCAAGRARMGRRRRHPSIRTELARDGTGL
jgi:hypothetical protein